jgi:hypothetical protein
LDPSKPSIQEIQKQQAWGKVIFMRKFVFLVGLFALAGLPALAQEGGSKDVSFEYSYVRANPATTGFPTFNANGAPLLSPLIRGTFTASRGKSAGITSARSAGRA